VRSVPLNPPFPPVTMPVCSQRGVGELTLGAQRVRTNGPASFTVAVEHSSCPFIRPNAGNRWHHLAFLSDDLDADVSRLEGVRYVRDIWAEDETGNLATFAYMLSPNGLRLEMTQISSELWDDSSTAEYDAAVDADLAAGVPPERAQGLRVDHVCAILDDPSGAAADLKDALAVECLEPVETEVNWLENGVSRQFTTRTIISISDPAIRLVSRAARCDRRGAARRDRCDRPLRRKLASQVDTHSHR
jgi:hypothetical protein